MYLELNLNFSDQNTVVVSLFNGIRTKRTGALPFENPITPAIGQDIRWYLETYASSYTTDVDDKRAAAIAAGLPDLGRQLFDAVFHEHSAHDLFRDFTRATNENRKLTISAEHPVILSLPWELLHDSAKGSTYIYHHYPRISISRRYEGSTKHQDPFDPKPQEVLRLLFVISRPHGAGFIDPRMEAQAVLDAIDEHAPGRVEVEFLRPARLDLLQKRLENPNLPPIHILHFDGHGVFSKVEPENSVNEILLVSHTSKAIAKQENTTPESTGHLIFEKEDGSVHRVTADDLGRTLFSKKIPLVVLSACQSAQLGADDAMGCVAARLTAAGIPAVIAMTHSVLVDTARRLFGEFYANLAEGRSIGTSLDNARYALYDNPERHEVQRGAVSYRLKLQDWFVPALYQTSADGPLLLESEIPPEKINDTFSNLPSQNDVIFCGRRAELWNIERWFVQGVRRVSISGFGGQGKTHLAQEAGRWLLRTGMFRRVVFVSFASFQGVDAEGSAISTIGNELSETLIDAAALTDSLKKTSTLLILDNLEDIPSEQMPALLSAAKEWSEAGQSRVLVTARPQELNHSAFALQNDPKHQHLSLGGLSETDAIALYNAVLQLPPEPTAPAPSRELLRDLFAKVQNHPLSIRLLSQQLKTRRAVDVIERLSEILQGDASEDKDKSLRASLKLSLDKLPLEIRDIWLPRLGVFQGGAMEDNLLAITGLGQLDEAPEIAVLRSLLSAIESGDMHTAIRLTLNIREGISIPDDTELSEEIINEFVGFADKLAIEVRNFLSDYPTTVFREGAHEMTWSQLKSILMEVGLIEVKDLSHLGITIPFLKFHPILAPTLWQQVTIEYHKILTAAHRHQYNTLSEKLYFADAKTPIATRSIAYHELPNLLHAVRGALNNNEDIAVNFADKVKHFLNIFGLKSDARDLNTRAMAVQVNEHNWFLIHSGNGEQLLRSGHIMEAIEAFNYILQRLGETPTYNRCVTLSHLGRCYEIKGEFHMALKMYDEALQTLDKQENNDRVERHRGVLLTDIGDVMKNVGYFTEARIAYEKSISIYKELGDLRGEGVGNGQIGTLALLQGDIKEAAKRYQETLTLFQNLNEPAMEAVALHQLGIIFQEAKEWGKAEYFFRQSAQIKEILGDLAGVARSWDQLAQVSELSGKVDTAEAWHHKALNAQRQIDDNVGMSSTLNNLANLLQNQPFRLEEARQMAEEAAAIQQRLAIDSVPIWKTLHLLSRIADKQRQFTQASEYRQHAREAYRNYVGSQHEIQRFAPIIKALTNALHSQNTTELENILSKFDENSFTELTKSIYSISSGERDLKKLQEPLDFQDSLIIEAILAELTELEKPKNQSSKINRV